MVPLLLDKLLLQRAELFRLYACAASTCTVVFLFGDSDFSGSLNPNFQCCHGARQQPNQIELLIVRVMRIECFEIVSVHLL